MGMAAPCVRAGAVSLETAEAELGEVELAAGRDGKLVAGCSQRPSMMPTTAWVLAEDTGAPLCPRWTSWLKRNRSVWTCDLPREWGAERLGAARSSSSGCGSAARAGVAESFDGVAVNGTEACGCGSRAMER